MRPSKNPVRVVCAGPEEARARIGTMQGNDKAVRSTEDDDSTLAG